MSSVDIAEEIRAGFPGTEELIVQYLSGYLVDDAGEEEDILQVARDMLESLAGDQSRAVDKLMKRISELLEDQLNARAKNKPGPKLTKLDKVMDLSKAGAMSNTIALGGEGVDLESINKGKWVEEFVGVFMFSDASPRASRVDVKKLEKQEA